MTAPKTLAGGISLALVALAQAAPGPAAPSAADAQSAYCLPILTLNKASLEILEYDDPAMERGRRAAIRAAESGIRRMERHLEARSKVVDQAALTSASGRGIADYRLMLAAAEACAASCAPGSDPDDRDAARCSVACQTAREPAVARANQCRALDWLP